MNLEHGQHFKYKKCDMGVSNIDTSEKLARFTITVPIDDADRVWSEITKVLYDTQFVCTAREKVLKQLINMAKELEKSWSAEKEDELCDVAVEWNRLHIKDAEIYVSEIFKEDGYYSNGIAIEDNVFYFMEENE